MNALQTGQRVKVTQLTQLDIHSLEDEYKPYNLHDKDWKDAAQAHISRRTTGVTGKLVSHIAGSDQRIWWVRHDNGEFSVYRAEELELLGVANSKIYDDPWSLTAEIYSAAKGTTFICAHRGLVSMGKLLAHYNRPNDDLKFELAPEELRKSPFQGIH